MQLVLALVVTTGAVNTACSSSESAVLPELNVARAVEGLMTKQGLEGSESEFGKGCIELEHMLDKRLELIASSDKVARILITESVGSLRM
jgi:hypothetical protein